MQIAKVIHVQSVLLFSHCNRLQLVVVYMATDTNCNDLHIFVLVAKKKQKTNISNLFPQKITERIRWLGSHPYITKALSRINHVLQMKLLGQHPLFN